MVSTVGKCRISFWFLFMCFLLSVNTCFNMPGFQTEQFHLSFHSEERIPGPYLQNEKTKRRVELFQCGVECMLDKECKSFNYFAKYGKCELSAYRFDPCVESTKTFKRTYLQRAPGWEHFTTLVLNKGMPQCCAERAYQRNSTGRTPLPDMPDAEYVLYPGAPRQTYNTSKFFCYRYDRDRPGFYRDYVSLLKENSFMFHSEDAPPELAKFQKNHGVTRYTKIRVSPLTLKINTNDRQYATSSSSNRNLLSYGYAYGCNPNSTTLKAKVTIDLRNTGFSIDKAKTSFVTGSTYTRRTAVTWDHSDMHVTYLCDYKYRTTPVTYTTRCGSCYASRLYLRKN